MTVRWMFFSMTEAAMTHMLFLSPTISPKNTLKLLETCSPFSASLFRSRSLSISRPFALSLSLSLFGNRMLTTLLAAENTRCQHDKSLKSDFVRRRCSHCSFPMPIVMSRLDDLVYPTSLGIFLDWFFCPFCMFIVWLNKKNCHHFYYTLLQPYRLRFLSSLFLPSMMAGHDAVIVGVGEAEPVDERHPSRVEDERSCCRSCATVERSSKEARKKRTERRSPRSRALRPVHEEASHTESLWTPSPMQVPAFPGFSGWAVYRSFSDCHALSTSGNPKRSQSVSHQRQVTRYVSNIWEEGGGDGLHGIFLRYNRRRLT